jgi:hypothetical protein
MQFGYSGRVFVRHLSISNSRSRYSQLLLFMAIWLLLLEIFFRIPAVRQRLVAFEHETFWYSPYVPARIQLIRDYPNADIWFVGASIVMQGANPAVIDPLLQTQDDHVAQSLNLALPGLLDIGFLEGYITDVFFTHRPT